MTFSAAPTAPSTHIVKTQVSHICSLISTAKRERKLLRLYLWAEQSLLCDNTMALDGHLCPAPAKDTYSLGDHLSLSSVTSGRSSKISLTRRLDLAFTLASTLLQLNTTPWLGKLWSKESIRFPGTGCVGAFPDLSQIDLTRPFIADPFTTQDSLAAIPRPDQREFILELGIMLHELWHETTIEAHYASQGVTSTSGYLHRVLYAQLWLETSEETFTAPYFDAIAYCIKGWATAASLNPGWDSAELCRGLVERMVEPLQSQCKPRR